MLQGCQRIGSRLSAAGQIPGSARALPLPLLLLAGQLLLVVLLQGRKTLLRGC